MITKAGKLIYTVSSQLRKPSVTNGVFLYAWSPGYKIQKKFLDQHGLERTKKEFIPTSTFEAAIAHLKNEYGTKEYLKFKEDAHPGHAAVETRGAYLSAATTDPVNIVGLKTQHPIVFARRFEVDLIAFSRLPESILDFYTLDSLQVEKAINEFKNSQLIYSLLGDRLYKTEGESCATSAFISLEAGGIENLLRADQWAFSKRGILTPALLASYTIKARDRERTLYKESVALSEQLLPEKRSHAEKVLESYIKRTEQDQTQSNISETSNKRGPST